jgi:hypothetical protein
MAGHFNIRRTPAELQAVRTNAARMVALSGDLAGTKWGQLQLLMMRWDRIEELASEPGPVTVLASRAGLRSVDLVADRAVSGMVASARTGSASGLAFPAQPYLHRWAHAESRETPTGVAASARAVPRWHRSGLRLPG